MRPFISDSSILNCNISIELVMAETPWDASSRLRWKMEDILGKCQWNISNASVHVLCRSSRCGRPCPRYDGPPFDTSSGECLPAGSPDSERLRRFKMLKSRNANM